MVTAMLFAGGIGARMKYSDMPKQFLEVGGKPIIIHTMEHFARHPKVDAIVVACKADWIGYLNELIEAFNVPKVKAVVPGGANGFDSIHNGVMATAEFSKDPEDIILICDGVRPMLSEELISNCITATSARPCVRASTSSPRTSSSCAPTLKSSPPLQKKKAWRCAALPPRAAAFPGSPLSPARLSLMRSRLSRAF